MDPAAGPGYTLLSTGQVSLARPQLSMALCKGAVPILSCTTQRSAHLHLPSCI